MIELPKGFAHRSTYRQPRSPLALLPVQACQECDAGGILLLLSVAPRLVSRDIHTMRAGAICAIHGNAVTTGGETTFEGNRATYAAFCESIAVSCCRRCLCSNSHSTSTDQLLLTQSGPERLCPRIRVRTTHPVVRDNSHLPALLCSQVLCMWRSTAC